MENLIHHQPEPTPFESPVGDSNVEREIPSVVAASQRNNTLLIGAFLTFMAFVGMMVCRKPKPKNISASVPQTDNSPTGPSLPAAVKYPKPAFAVPVNLATTAPKFDTGSRASGLFEVRRNSPVVIYNKTPSPANVGGTSGATGGGPETALPGGGSPSSEGAQAALGVPLPSGFSPSNTETAHATLMGNRDFMLAQGKLLDAVLETAVDSDHPGLLRAIISHDVYGDSGRTILLPRGSRLIGQYDSAVARGQNRVFVIWQRVIRPDGIDVQLGSAGTDALGRTGIEGNVNNHFFMMFGAAAVLSVIGASASTVGVNAQDQNNSLSQYRQSITQGFNGASNTVLGQFVQIKPTITIRQGIGIKVFLARDLYFDPPLLNNSNIEVIP